METPLSTRRVTRSQILASATNSCNINNILMSRKFEDSEKDISSSKSGQRTEKQQQDRCVLIDITNDSPIVGLAMGSLEETATTPTSSKTMSKKMRNNIGAKKKTPGSGEALLRGQVKTLLQRVEEETEISKFLLDHKPFQQQFQIYQMVSETFDGVKQEEVTESEKSLISRSLLLDFFEKTEGFDSSECASVLTQIGEESEGKEKLSMEDDDSSVWSIQVNASTKEEEEEDNEDGIEEVEEDEDYVEVEEEQGDDDGVLLVDELCEGMRKISVNGETTMPKFSGKHTRFMYDSDDELQGEEECCVSPGIVRLKGLPTPKGKHLRFP